MADAPKKTLADLIAVMAALRAPKTGCPWDLEQSFATIAPYTIEEAYEVADAIERADLIDLKEELGDLLLQVVYHARIAEEAGAFGFDDVVDDITHKMVRRHPHVFGDQAARSAGMAKGAWERIKAEEKAEKARAKSALGGSSDHASAQAGARSLLADVPHGLPALTRAIKLQEAAARVGFDWPSIAPVFDKLREEMAELEAIALPADPRRDAQPEAIQAASTSGAITLSPDDPAHIEEELGDLLFVVANVARHLSINPETALRRANAKFSRRFQHIERVLEARGSSPAHATLDEMDTIWNEAKATERKP